MPTGDDNNAWKKMQETYNDSWNEMPESYKNAWVDAYNMSSHPDFNGSTVSQVNGGSSVYGHFDEDLWNSIDKNGLGGMSWNDITPEQWNGVYNDYMKGYNEFSNAHPTIPYGNRMDDGFRKQWDNTYEGYVGEVGSPASVAVAPDRRAERAARREEKTAARAAARQERDEARQLRREEKEERRQQKAMEKAYVQEQRAKDRLAREAERKRNQVVPSVSDPIGKDPYDISDEDDMENWNLEQWRRYTVKNGGGFYPGFTPDGDYPQDTPKNEVSNGGKKPMAAAHREEREREAVMRAKEAADEQMALEREMESAPLSTAAAKRTRTLPSDRLMQGIAGDSYLMSPEEEQRRMNRMRTASAIGNLGNVMSAFANLYYTGKGAPSQKVPDAVIPPYMQFEDRVNQARRNAEAMKMQRDRLASQDAYHDRQMAVQEERNRINAVKTEAYTEYYKAMEAKNNEQAAYWKTKAEALERGLPLDEALKQAKKAQAEAAAENSRASAERNRAQANVANAKADAERNGKTVVKVDSVGNTTRTTTTPNKGKEKTKTQL